MDISFLVVALFRVSFMVPIEAEIASTDFAVLMANSMSYSKVIAGAVVVADARPPFEDATGREPGGRMVEDAGPCRREVEGLVPGEEAIGCSQRHRRNEQRTRCFSVVVHRCFVWRCPFFIDSYAENM